MADLNQSRVLDLLLQAERLKIVQRGGWAIRGLPEVESVADHSYGVIFIALVLSQLIQETETPEEPIDRAKVLTMALIHDLPESLITDIPAPATRYFPAGAKSQAELNALDDMLRNISFGNELRTLWQEFEDCTSIEARLVHDADRLELLLQAYIYERATANQELVEFWDGQQESAFEFQVTRQLFSTMRSIRRDMLISCSARTTGRNLGNATQK
jgi:putative hydrolase of HD superfamily